MRLHSLLTCSALLVSLAFFFSAQASLIATYEGEAIVGNHKECYYNFQGGTLTKIVKISSDCPMKVVVE